MISYATRLVQLLDVIGDVGDEDRPYSNSIRYKSATLSFAVEKGQSMLVMGPNGCGKTTLLRELRGLWPANAQIMRPQLVADDAEATIQRQKSIGSEHDHVMFLTQHCYLPFRRSLLEQVVYPASVTSTEDLVEMERLAHLVGLSAVLERYGWHVRLGSAVYISVYVGIWGGRPSMLTVDFFPSFCASSMSLSQRDTL